MKQATTRKRKTRKKAVAAEQTTLVQNNAQAVADATKSKPASKPKTKPASSQKKSKHSKPAPAAPTGDHTNPTKVTADTLDVPPGSPPNAKLEAAISTISTEPTVPSAVELPGSPSIPPPSASTLQADKPKTRQPKSKAKASKRQKNARRQTSRSRGVNAKRPLEIRFNLPRMPKLRRLLPAGLSAWRTNRLLKQRKRTATLGAAAGLALVGLILFQLFINKQQLETVSPLAASSAIAASQKPGSLPKGTPDYHTLTPSGKSIDSLGGWTRISPPERNPVYAFIDHIDKVQINVSQQPLPKDFIKNTSRRVEQLARGYDADKKLTVGDQPVFVGTSTEGPQSVIFHKDQVLVLIKSSKQLSDKQWTNYIKTLN